MTDRLVARWETRDKKYWYELHRNSSGQYYYRGGGGIENNTLHTSDQATALNRVGTVVLGTNRSLGINLKLVTPVPTKRKSTVQDVARRTDQDAITIDGEKYYKVAYVYTKPQAQSQAKVWRDRGYRTRVIKSASAAGYNLYSKKRN